jgi:hypothetical protein
LDYLPKPIDTKEASIPESLLPLQEYLAEHLHDVWAERRIAEGWIYGLSRNDGKKEHPCLIPYTELPESEKEYDRAAAAETIKAIIVLGYSIKRN